MIVSGLLGLLAGLLIGGRLKIFAIVPLQVVAVLAAIGPAIFGEAPLAHQLGAGLVFCLALQVGYVLRLAIGPLSAPVASVRAHEG
jgi:hypothetical protein